MRHSIRAGCKFHRSFLITYRRGNHSIPPASRTKPCSGLAAPFLSIPYGGRPPLAFFSRPYARAYLFKVACFGGSSTLMQIASQWRRHATGSQNRFGPGMFPAARSINVFAMQLECLHRVGFAHLLGRLAARADDIGIYPYQKLIHSALHFRESFLVISYYVAA
jgi:hypothetical protein